MLLSLVYFVVVRLLRVLAPSARTDPGREAELLVLRHQLKVISRQVQRPTFRRRDRILLVALSRILPRERWNAFGLRRHKTQSASETPRSEAPVLASLAGPGSHSALFPHRSHPFPCPAGPVR